MKRKILQATVVVWVVCASVCVFAEPVEHFSATQVIYDEKNRVENEGKIYMRSGNMRLDMKAPEGDGQMVMIFRPDMKKQWMLNIDKQMYFEKVYDEAEMKKSLHEFTSIQKERILGQETVNGFDCTKKEVVNTIDFMGISRTVKTTVWQSDRLPMPIRTRNEHGGGMELREIVIKKPNSKLFKLPSDYTKAESMIAFFASFDENEKYEETPAKDDSLPGLKDIKEMMKGIKLPFEN